MRFLSRDEIASFLSQRNFDIRISHNEGGLTRSVPLMLFL